MAKNTYVYEVEMLKLSDKLEIEIEADDENSRNAYFNKFLIDKDERHFFHKPTNRGYNKDYIYSWYVKGVK